MSKKSKDVLIKEMIANPNVLSENLVYLYNSTIGSSAVLKTLGDEILSAVDKEQLSRESYGDGSAFAKGWDAKKILTQDKYRGKTAILSTGMTGSGHFVVLQQVHSDGITIHDPYGAKISSHLNESKTAKSLRSLANKPVSKEILERRFSKNGRLPSLMKIDPKEALPSDIGENVFFSWAECDAYKIGCVVTG